MGLTQKEYLFTVCGKSSSMYSPLGQSYFILVRTMLHFLINLVMAVTFSSQQLLMIRNWFLLLQILFWGKRKSQKVIAKSEKYGGRFSEAIRSKQLH
ncbi:hypothetical protein CEXT_334741 [Caerostris extrusa]|uniref:Uncharacterized protein n=1 Tax=Caerostris extrusa TaxID=172846 RepID=A0AAV4PQZ7_CAEEX|nr:hypothetical protein CEXT_334741 [Caerostris extrusa]